MSALALILGAALAQDPAGWPADRELPGWTLLSHNERTAMFVRPTRKPSTDGRPRLLIRYESREPALREADEAGAPFDVLSAVALDSFDCAGRRTATLEMTKYGGPRLTGPARTRRSAAPAWSQDGPGSMGETVRQAACAPPRPVAHASAKHHRSKRHARLRRSAPPKSGR